jgi:hypothetical protein
MSSLQSAFAIKAFRDALGAAVTQAQTNPDSIRKSLRSDAKAPKGVDEKTWLNLVGAVRLAYLTARREDRAEVNGDIRTSLAGAFPADEVDRFLELLSQDDAIDARNAAVLGNTASTPDLGIEDRDDSTRSFEADLGTAPQSSLFLGRTSRH